MILTGDEIARKIGQDIKIDPYDPDRLNPNGYDLTLHNELLTYEEVVLDMRKSNRTRRIRIPDDGLVLNPSQLYLARTAERTETFNHVPMIQGRSSIARLGLFIDATTGFGDVGFCGYWTLEFFAVQPVRIYPGIPICQIMYHTVEGNIREYQSDKYQHNQDIQPSLMYRELNPDAVEEDPQARFQFEV